MHDIYDVAIVGGGISGLVAAYCLAKNSRQRFILLEKEERAGGMIQTAWQEGFLVEAGPISFQDKSGSIISLCRSLDLNPVETSSLAKNRYIFHKGTLQKLPGNPAEFAMSGLISPYAKIRTLISFISPFSSLKKLEEEILDDLIGPFLSSIYRSDSSNGKSLRESRFFTFENGLSTLTDVLFNSLPVESVVLGASVRSIEYHGNHYKLILSNSEEIGRVDSWVHEDADSRKEQPGVYTEINDAAEQRTTSKMLRHFGASKNLSEAPHDTSPKDFEDVSCGDREDAPQGPKCQHALKAKALLLATPSWVTAELIKPLSPETASLLEEISYVPLSVVHFGFKKEEIPHDLNGFGFLISRSSEKMSLFGATCTLFPDHVPKNQLLISCYLKGTDPDNPISNWFLARRGGPLWPPVSSEKRAGTGACPYKINRNSFWIEVNSDELNNSILVSKALDDLGKIFKKPGLKPSFCRRFQYPRAMPQYTIGHKERISCIKKNLERDLPGLFLCGSYLNGLSLDSCVKEGSLAASSMIDYS